MTAWLADEAVALTDSRDDVATMPEAPPAPRLRPAPPTDVPHDSEPEDQSCPVAAVPTLPGLDRTLWPQAAPQPGRDHPVPRDPFLEPGPMAGRSARQLSLGGATPRRPGASGAHRPSGAGPRAVVLVRALLEVVAGVRPVGQLRGSVTPALALELEERRHTGPPRRPATLLSMRLSEPDTGVAEVSAVVRRPGHSGRCGALAVRMEQRQGRWVVCRLVMG